MIVLKKIFQKGLLRNFSVLVLCNFAVHLTNLLTNMYLARTLGPTGFGEYGIIITWAAILQSVSSLGIQQVAIRHIAKDTNNSLYYFKVSLFARGIGLITTAVLFCLYGLFVESITVSYIAIIIIYTLGLFLWDTIQNVAFGMQRMESTGIINAIGAIITILLLLLIPLERLSIFLVMIVLILVQCIKDYTYYKSCKIHGYFVQNTIINISFRKIWHIIKESFPFYCIVIFSLFTTQLPVLFLSANTNLEEVAYFNTANKLMIPLSMILQTLMVAIFPKFVKDYSINPLKFYKGSRQSLLFIAYAGSIMCFIISLFRNEIVLLIYGEEYRNTGMVMLAQSWYVVYFSIISFYGTILASLNRDKMLAVLTIVNSVVWTPIIWYASHYGAVYMSYGFIIGGIVNLISNSICIKVADTQIFTYRFIFLLNLSLILCVLASFCTGNEIPILIRLLLVLFMVAISFMIINYKFKKIGNAVNKL